MVTDASSGSQELQRAALRGLPAAEQTLPALLQRQAARFEQKLLVETTGGDTRTYGELRDAAAAWAGTLEAAGIERGDRVAAIAGSSLELLELVLGCAWMGATAVPLNTAIRAGALQHALTSSGARALIIETEHLDALARVPPPASLERVWLLDRQRAHRAYGYRCEPLPALEEPVEPAAVGPGDTFAILYTPGTSGTARGVCCPHAQLYWRGVLGGELLAIGREDVCFTALPLFGLDGIGGVYDALLAGATCVVAPRFTPARYWRLAAEHGATVTYLPGKMVETLLSAPRSRDDSLHEVRVALSRKVTADSYEPFTKRFGARLLDGYSSIETGRVTGVPGDPPRPGSLGRALAEFEVAIVDGNDAPLGPGEHGELVVRPRQPFSIATGYFGMPQATTAAWRNLWFHTGERAVRDADGWLALVAGAADSIHRRGATIATIEIEQALMEHPDVVAAAVFATHSDVADDEVMATLVLAPGRDELDPEELIEFCRPRITELAMPRYIEFVAALPVTDDGTIAKDELRERGVGDETWDRERSGYRRAQTATRGHAPLR